MMITDIRPSPIAGRWYPDNSEQLATSLDEYMSCTEDSVQPKEIVAFVVPHAGHRYSGAVAGHAFALARGLSPELVVVVSPMHRACSQPLLTSGHDAYQTPLGPIMIDQAAVAELDTRLTNLLGFGLAPVRNDDEHSLEIELPFLQRALVGDFSLLPVMVRDQTPRVARALGLALAKTLAGRDSLLVASTDLSHFYPQSVAHSLDQVILKHVAALDPEAIFRAERDGRGFACGRGALTAVIWAAKELGATSATILNYATSGDISGDYSQVVGYGAAIITRTLDQK